MDPKTAVTAPATSNANAAIGELPDISTTEYKFIKPHHFADFFAKNKFSGAAEYAARYFRDLQQALSSLGWAAIGKGQSSVIAYDSLEEQRYYEQYAQRTTVPGGSESPPSPTASAMVQPPPPFRSPDANVATGGWATGRANAADPNTNGYGVTATNADSTAGSADAGALLHSNYCDCAGDWAVCADNPNRNDHHHHHH